MLELPGLGLIYKVAGIGVGSVIADFVFRAVGKEEIAKLIEFAGKLVCIGLIMYEAFDVMQQILDITWNTDLPYFDIFGINSGDK